jgi:hypothetical protein
MLRSLSFSCVLQEFPKWRDPESNRGHHDFQSCALPTELSRRVGDAPGRGRPREDSRLREACYQGRGAQAGSGSLVMSGLFPGEPLELESGLEHLLGEGTHDGLGLFAGLE